MINNTPQNYKYNKLRAIVHAALGDREHARADDEKASSLLTNDPSMLADRAWTDLTGPIAQRDPDKAVMLARRAAELAPRWRLPLYILGVALYRTGQYAEAISYLDRSLVAGNGEADALDLFFLAMAHDQLGHDQRGRGYYDRAVRWVGAQKGMSDSQTNTLTALRAEAESTLAHFADDLPDRVFANPQ